MRNNQQPKNTMNTNNTETAPQEIKWQRQTALAVAVELIDHLAPYCERIEIVGSVRRRKLEVKDVELLFIPKYEPRSLDLFATELVDLAAEKINELVHVGTLSKRLSKIGHQCWGAKMKLAVHATGLPIDLFSTDAECWFNEMVCRTGPADLNKEIAMRAERRRCRWHSCGVGFDDVRDGTVYRMSSEREVFEFVGIKYREPWERQ